MFGGGDMREQRSEDGPARQLGRPAQLPHITINTTTINASIDSSQH